MSRREEHPAGLKSSPFLPLKLNQQLFQGILALGIVDCTVKRVFIKSRVGAKVSEENGELLVVVHALTYLCQ
jgi:hypothetical protein